MATHKPGNEEIKPQPLTQPRIDDAVMASIAACGNLQLISCDKLRAMGNGWGAIPVGVFVMANAISNALTHQKIQDITLKNEDLPIPVCTHVLEESIRQAVQHGVEASDASLISATLLYLVGVQVRVGVAAGEQSLGRIARKAAGVPTYRAQAIPTPWGTSRLTGEAAHLAVTQALLKHQLTSVNCQYLIPGVGSTPVVDDSVLGEDIIGPELAKNASHVATQAMIDAYGGSGSCVNKLMCALIGTAVALDLINADSAVGESHGRYGKTCTLHLAGESAVQTAQLPATLHVRGSQLEFSTAKLVGELGLILKEAGCPTKVGMLALQELFGLFEEGFDITGALSGGPLSASLGFLNGFAGLGLILFKEHNGDIATSAQVMSGIFQTAFFDPTFASMGYNTVASYAQGLLGGPVSEIIVTATEGIKVNMLTQQSYKIVHLLEHHRDVEKIAKQLDQERIEQTEKTASAFFSASTGKKIDVKILKISGGARRATEISQRFLALDCDVDVALEIDGKTYLLNRLFDQVVPLAVATHDEALLKILPFATIPVFEMVLASHTIINATLVAALAHLLLQIDSDQAAQSAEKGAWISCGTPGAKAKCKQAALNAKVTYEALGKA